MGSDTVYRHDDLVSTFEYYIAEAENGLCRVPRRVAADALLRIMRDAARIAELEAALSAATASAEAAEAEAARLREALREAREAINHALMALPFPEGGARRRAWSGLIDARDNADAALAQSAPVKGGE